MVKEHKQGIELLADGTSQAAVSAHQLLFPSSWPTDNWDVWLHETKERLLRREREDVERKAANVRDEQLRQEGKLCTLYYVYATKDKPDYDVSYEEEVPLTRAEFNQRFQPKVYDWRAHMEGPCLALDKLKEGDLVDTSGYRGQGLWYFDGTRFHKSIGEYGYFLRSIAFTKVQQYGLPFFEHCGAAFVLIPSSADKPQLSRRRPNRSGRHHVHDESL